MTEYIKRAKFFIIFSLFLCGDRLYICSDEGLYILTDYKKIILMKDPLINLSIFDGIVIKDEILLATDHGLWRFKGSFERLNSKDTHIKKIYYFRDKLYIGGFVKGGLYITTKPYTTFEEIKDFQYKQITDIESDKNQDRLYIAVYGEGLYYKDKDEAIFKKVELPENRIRTVKVHPQYPNIVFVGTDAGLYRSEDYGKNFTLVKYTEDKIIYAILADKENVYFGSWVYGVYKSVDKGGKFFQVICGMKDTNIYSLVKKGKVLYAASEDCVYQSFDGAMHWTKVF
jgi:ligand-binding sensor domain-containing protein